MLSESCSLGRERKLGGTFHLRLNTNSSPIANKYREGKVQSTLERELNVPELVACQVAGSTGSKNMVSKYGIFLYLRR